MERKTQTLDVGPEIQGSVYRPQVMGYLDKQGIIIPVDFDRVEWEATRRAMEMSPYLYQMWAENQVTDFWVVGKMINIWDIWEDEECLECDQLTHQNHRNYLICRYQRLLRARNNKIGILIRWIEYTTATEVAMAPLVFIE